MAENNEKNLEAKLVKRTDGRIMNMVPTGVFKGEKEIYQGLEKEEFTVKDPDTGKESVVSGYPQRALSLEQVSVDNQIALMNEKSALDNASQVNEETQPRSQVMAELKADAEPSVETGSIELPVGDAGAEVGEASEQDAEVIDEETADKIGGELLEVVDVHDPKEAIADGESDDEATPAQVVQELVDMPPMVELKEAPKAAIPDLHTLMGSAAPAEAAPQEESVDNESVEGEGDLSEADRRLKDMNVTYELRLDNTYVGIETGTNSVLSSLETDADELDAQIHSLTNLSDTAKLLIRTADGQDMTSGGVLTNINKAMQQINKAINTIKVVKDGENGFLGSIVAKKASLETQLEGFVAEIKTIDSDFETTVNEFKYSKSGEGATLDVTPDSSLYTTALTNTKEGISGITRESLTPQIDALSYKESALYNALADIEAFEVRLRSGSGVVDTNELASAASIVRMISQPDQSILMGESIKKKVQSAREAFQVPARQRAAA